MRPNRPTHRVVPLLDLRPTIPTLVERCAPACAASGKKPATYWCDSTSALSRLVRASFALHHRLTDALGGAGAYDFRTVHTLSILLPPHPVSTSASHPLLPALGRPFLVRCLAEGA